MDQVGGSASPTQPVTMATVAPVPITPKVTTAMETAVNNDGDDMMEVIRSDGKQVYHTVNVNVDGVMKKIEIPLGKSLSGSAKADLSDAPKSSPSSMLMPTSSPASSVSTDSSDTVAKMTSIPNIASIAGSLTVPRTSTSVQVVMASSTRPRTSVAVSPYNIVRPLNQNNVSLLPTGSKIGIPVIRQAMPGQQTRPTIFIVPKGHSLAANRMGMTQMMVGPGQNKGIPILPLPGGKFIVPKTQGMSTSLPGGKFIVPNTQSISTTSGGKTLVTFVTQGQISNQAKGMQMVVAPRPNISLPPGFALVPVTSSNALKPSDVLNIPAVNKGPMDNKALSDLLKSIAQQTVNSKKDSVVPTVTTSTNIVPVKASSLPTPIVTVSPSVSIAGSSSSVPQPAVSSSGQVTATGTMLTPFSTQSSKAVVHLATATTSTSIPAIKPMDMSDIKIDSVYSLTGAEKKISKSESSTLQQEKSANQNDDTHDEETRPEAGSPSKETDETTENDRNDVKDDFVVLAEWAKESESDNEDDGHDFDDTDVESNPDLSDNLVNRKDDDNCSVDMESDAKDERALIKKMKHSPTKDPDIDSAEEKEDDIESDTTEIADYTEFDAEIAESLKKALDSMEEQFEETMQKEMDNQTEERLETDCDIGKEGKNQVIEGTKSKKILEKESDVSSTCHNIKDKINTNEKNEKCKILHDKASAEVKVEMNGGDESNPKNSNVVDAPCPLRLVTEPSPIKIKKEEIKIAATTDPVIKHRRSSCSSGRGDSESPRAKMRRRKRKLKKIMKLQYWKREHIYMYDCKVLLPKLSDIDGSVDVNTFKPPVIPKNILSKVRYVGDPNWTDVLVDRIPNRQHKRKTKHGEEGSKLDQKPVCKKSKVRKQSKEEEVFIVQTINGESKLVKVDPTQKKTFSCIPPKLFEASQKSRTVNTSTTAIASTSSSSSSSSKLPLTVTSSQSSPVKVSSAPISLLLSKSNANTTSASSAMNISGKKKIHIPVVVGPNGRVANIAKPTGITQFTRTQVAKPTGITQCITPQGNVTYVYPSKDGKPLLTKDGKPILTTNVKTPSSLKPIAPAKKTKETYIPVSVAGTTVSVPCSVLAQAQAMGCKLAFQIPRASSRPPRPFLIHPKASTVAGGMPAKTTLLSGVGVSSVKSTLTVASNRMPGPLSSMLPTSTGTPVRATLVPALGGTPVKTTLIPMVKPGVSPVLITPAAGAATTSLTSNSTSEVLTSQTPNLTPLVIAPIPSTESNTLEPTPPITSTAPTPIVIQPITTSVSPSETTTVSSMNPTVTTTVPSPITSTSAATPNSSNLKLSGNQKYLVLNTSSGKMIMPMPASFGGSGVSLGKSILNLASVRPASKPTVVTLPSSVGGNSPIFIMPKSAGISTSASQPPVTISSNARPPIVVKRLTTGSAGNKASFGHFVIRPQTPGGQPTIVRTLAPATTMQATCPTVTTTVTTTATSPKQRSPAARQNRMIQRLSEFMSPAAAAALAATVPAEPIEITPQPIKIEPDDSAEFNFPPVQIKEEPKTFGYGDEDGNPGPSLENVKIKDEPASSDSDSDSEEGNCEPPTKQVRMTISPKPTNLSNEPSPLARPIDPPPSHDARSRIQELREKLRKAMADVDEIRQKRQGVLQEGGESDDS